MTNLQPPAHSELVKVAFPVPHVLLLSLNRPSALNAMSQAMHADINAMLDWFEHEPELWYVSFLPFVTVLGFFWGTMRQRAVCLVSFLVTLGLFSFLRVASWQRLTVFLGLRYWQVKVAFSVLAQISKSMFVRRTVFSFLSSHSRCRYYSLHIGQIENTLIFFPF